MVRRGEFYVAAEGYHLHVPSPHYHHTVPSASCPFRKKGIKGFMAWKGVKGFMAIPETLEDDVSQGHSDDRAMHRHLMNGAQRFMAMPETLEDDASHRHDIASSLQGPITFSHGKLIHAYMLETGLIRDTYLANLVLRLYGNLGALADARSLFHAMRRHNIISWNTIITAYVHCKALEGARMLFDGMPQRNVVSWNALMAAYAHQGKGKEAILLFQRMHQENEMPNDITFMNVLSACGSLGDLETGKLIHVLANACAFGSGLTVGTALISMYAKCRALKAAHCAFGQLCQHDVVSWTALISAHTQLGDAREALNLFRQMQQEGVEPNKLTFQSILSAVSNVVSLSEGKEVHVCIHFGGFKLDVDTASSLINMYGKCGCIKHAWLVFESVDLSTSVAWNAMVVACMEQAHHWQALLLFGQMLRKGVKPNEFTFASALSACTCLMDLNRGVLIHSYLVEEGYMLDVIVSNALINLYSKCKALENAKSIFEKMFSRSVVTWTCMIAAYAQERHDQQALELFYRMQLEELKLNDVTIVSALSVCGDPAALEEGRKIHAWIVHNRMGMGITIGNAIVSMYGKCGALADACSVFNHLHSDNVVSWNAMMAAYAHGGHGQEALACFLEMQGKGIVPDELTYISLLSACSHAGLVYEGSFCFVYMAGDQHISIVLEHCVCMVDLLGRAGQLVEAQSFICSLPVLPDPCLWSAVLAACKTHGDRDLARHSAECILEFD